MVEQIGPYQIGLSVISLAELSVGHFRSMTSNRSEDTVKAEIAAAYAAAGPPPSEHQIFGDYVKWLTVVQESLPPEVWDGMPTDERGTTNITSMDTQRSAKSKCRLR